MITVYLAAPWKRREEARATAERLKKAGFYVNSRWLTFHGDSDDPVVLRREAQNDLDDIDACDVFVVLNLELSEGKAFETAYALSKGLPVIVVGPMLNIFYHLPSVKHAATIEDAIEMINDDPWAA